MLQTIALSLVEFKRALMYMQLPIVAFLAIASFQVHRTTEKAAFALAGYGWLLNFGYVGLSSLQEFLRGIAGGPDFRSSGWDSIASFLDIASGACFVLAYLAGGGNRLLPPTWFRFDTLALVVSVVAGWVMSVFALQEASAHPTRFIALSAPLVAFSFFARVLLGKALLEQTKAEVSVGEGPFHLYVGCLVFAAIQPLYLLSEAIPSSQTLGFLLGFAAKAAIAQGFVRLFSAMSSKFASEQKALDTARRILGRIRHELNTPLGEIKNWIDAALGESPSHGKLRQHLQYMESAAQRALAITAVRDDVLYQAIAEFEPATEDPGTASKVVANINTILQTAILAVKTTRSEEYTWHVSFSGGNCIRCSREQVTQVFVNLLRNACDAIPASGGRITVITQQVKEGSDDPHDDQRRVKIVVRDDGEGFDSSVHELAFTDGFTTRIGRDRGHGLAVVRQMLALNDGTITIASPVRETNKDRPGTEITVLFPKVPCE